MERGLEKIQWILWQTKWETENHWILNLEWNVYSSGNSYIQHRQQHNFKPSCRGSGFLLLVLGWGVLLAPSLPLRLWESYGCSIGLILEQVSLYLSTDKSNHRDQGTSWPSVSSCAMVRPETCFVLRGCPQLCFHGLHSFCPSALLLQSRQGWNKALRAAAV